MMYAMLSHDHGGAPGATSTSTGSPFREIYPCLLWRSFTHAGVGAIHLFSWARKLPLRARLAAMAAADEWKRGADEWKRMAMAAGPTTNHE